MVQDSVPSVNIGLIILSVTQVQKQGYTEARFKIYHRQTRQYFMQIHKFVPAVNRSEARSVGD
jgi:hypothetical protein